MVVKIKESLFNQITQYTKFNSVSNIIKTKRNTKITPSEIKYLPIKNDIVHFTKIPDEVLPVKVIIERSTGKKYPVIIKTLTKDDKIFIRILKQENNNELGYSILELPGNSYFPGIYKKDYISQSLEIGYIETVNRGNKASPYRGIGTELLKAAVLESKRNGYSGRIHLMAMDVHPPTPFYYKCGLKFADEKKHKAMLEYLAKENEIELDEALKSGFMYLPEENIDRLLQGNLVDLL